MREIRVQVGAGAGEQVLEVGGRHAAFWTAVAAVGVEGERRDLVFLALPDRAIGQFVREVAEALPGAEFVLVPRGTLPFRAPLATVHDQVRNVTHLSTLELVLSSLQSIGSWRGLLLYAVFSGIVAAYGITFNIVFLVTAAMLIAPMGGPAMVCVIGAAVGDWRMLLRGAVRFWVAVALLCLTAVVLGYANGLQVSTSLMELITTFSHWAVVLTLAAGAAGAQAQVQSDRSSLVGGVATGFLVAASLSPPAAVLGLSVVIGRWDYVGEMAFILVLTFFAIIAGGWLALLLFGVRPGQPSAERGTRRMRSVLCGGAVLVVVGLVAWQAQAGPGFGKSDLSTQALTVARDAVDGLGSARLIEGSAAFTRRRLPELGGQVLLYDLVVQQRGELAGAGLEGAVRDAVARETRLRMQGVTPVVVVSVVPPPAGAASPW